jgi:outer membrane protein W
MNARLALLVTLFLSLSAFAGSPVFEAGARFVNAQPRNGGGFKFDRANGYAVAAELFWTESISTRIDAAFTEPPASLGPTDLGTMGVNPVTLTARWHLLPRARISPFVGAGVAYVNLGDLDDVDGDAVLLSPKSKITGAAEAGVRFRWQRGIYLDATATYLPLKTDLVVRRNTIAAPLPAQLKLDPVILGVGFALRF